MVFRMVTARRSRSGSLTARKAIPKDVRADYQRLYGAGWEAKLTLPAGTPTSVVKTRHGEFVAEVETRIESNRAARRGEGIRSPGNRPMRSQASGTSGTSRGTKRTLAPLSTGGCSGMS